MAIGHRQDAIHHSGDAIRLDRHYGVAMITRRLSITVQAGAIPLFVGLLGVSPLVSPSAQEPRAPRVDDALATLRWMRGCWRQHQARVVTDEQWMAPHGGAMIGMSRTVIADRIRAWEALRLVVDSGRIVYIAQPNGGTPVRFRATTMSDSMAVFENPEHDFPQRIAYRRVRSDSLIAQVSGAANGTTRRMDIPMHRVVCDA